MIEEKVVKTRKKAVGESERVIKEEGRAPRVPMSNGDFKLQLPPSIMQMLKKEKKKAHWFEDDGHGRIEMAKAAWWDHITDAEGKNITAQSGSRKLYAMMIDEDLYNKDELLRMKNYRDSIGANESAELGVAGVQTFSPTSENSIKVSKDPFLM